MVTDKEQAENSTRKPQAKRAPRKSTVVDQRTSEDTCPHICISKQPSNDKPTTTTNCSIENHPDGSVSPKGGKKRVAAKQPRKNPKTGITDEPRTSSDVKHEGTNLQNSICEASQEREGSPIKVCVFEVPSGAQIEGVELNSKRTRKSKKNESLVIIVGDTSLLSGAAATEAYEKLSFSAELPAVKDTENPHRATARSETNVEADSSITEAQGSFGVDRIVHHSNTPKRTPREEIQRLRSILTSNSHLRTVDLCLKWTNRAQSALLLLSSITSVPVSQLLTKLGLSTELVLYDAENEDFEPCGV